MLKAQGGECAICHSTLTLAKSCMDHDHVTGQVRGILCRTCNGLEGKIKNLLIRWAGKHVAENILGGVILYWRKYRTNPNQFLYPTHRDEDEKRLLRNMRARKKRAATKKVK